MVEFSMYSIGSGAFLREVFNGLAMITGTGDFVKAVMIGMLFSVLLVCFQAILRGGREIAWQNILVGWILYGMFFAVPARVVVEDVYNGQVYSVDNVPLGTAAAGSMISKIGYGLAELIETGYGTADRVTQLPYLNTLQLLLWSQEGAKSSFFFDKLDNKTGLDTRATLNEYLRNCVVPTMTLRGTTSGKSPREEPVRDLLALGKDDTNNYSALYKKSSSGRDIEAVKCSVAYSEISSKIIPQLGNETSATLFDDQLRDWSEPGSDNYDLTGKRNLAQVFNRLSFTAQSRQDYMLASVIRPIFDDAFRQWHTRSQTAADLMIAQALIQRNYQWASEQSMWSTVVIPLMTFFEGFVYAITPFVALLLFTGSMGLGLIGKYLQVLFWINLWMPLMSICNLYITMSVDRSLQTMNLNTMDGVAQVVPMLQNQIAVGGMLMTATPMLALFIVTGSTYAFTTLTSRLGGGDHVNERMIAPDVANVGSVYDQAVYQHGTRGFGTITKGMEYRSQYLSFKRSISSAIASAYQKAKQATESWANTYMNNKQLQTDIAHMDGWNDNLQVAIGQQFSNLSEHDKAAALSLIESGGGDAELGVGVSAGIKGSLTVKSGTTYNDSNIVNAKKAISLARTQAAAQTLASQKADTVRTSFSQGEMNSFQHTAQTALSEVESFTKTSQLSDSMDGGYGFHSFEAGYQISQALENGNNKQAVSEAMGKAVGIAGYDYVAQRANFYNSPAGGNIEINQARAMAALEGCFNKGTEEAAEAAINLYTVSGGTPVGPSANPYANGNIATPGSTVENIGGVPAGLQAAADRAQNNKPPVQNVTGVGRVLDENEKSKTEFPNSTPNAQKASKAAYASKTVGDYYDKMSKFYGDFWQAATPKK